MEKQDLFTIKKRCINSLASKLSISAKRLGKRLVKIINDIFAVIGVIVMVAEAASEIFGYSGLFEFYKNRFGWIISAIVIGCIWKNWDRLKMTVRIVDSPDVTISLQICDALKGKDAVIIPTNTTFDTKMDDEFISAGSIQGQYQLKYFKNKLSDLDKLITDGLNGKDYITLNDGRSSKNKRYMIGTVCRINEKSRRAYFLADSDINAKGIPIDVDASDISMSLVSLWDTLAIEGNQEPYRIPLLGTGKARAKDASRNEIVREIVLTFLAATKEHKITESLTICIHPRDFDKIDWDALCEFVKYESQYTNIKPMFSKPSGLEEKTPSVVKLKDEEIVDDTSEDIPGHVVVPHLQKPFLSEKEKLMITILQGNEMKKSEVAAAMGLTMNATTRILSKLQSAGLVQSKGGARNIIYFASADNADS